MHPQAASAICRNVISAHTLSRRSLLGAIVDGENHVLSFKNPDPLTDRSNPVRVGWKQASTFPGFCSLHDQIFSPIDSTEFKATTEQCFLLSYRGMCHELFQKMAAREDYTSMLSTLDRGKPFDQQVEIQRAVGASLMGTLKGLKELGKHKAALDNSLLSGNYNPWKRSVFFFKGPLSVASAGTFSPNKSLLGKKIQIMHDVNTPQQPLILNVTATNDGSAVVLYWKADHGVVSAFVQDIAAQPPNRIAGLLIQLMFAYLSNTYFSKSWWDWLPPASKQHLSSLAQISNAYYTDFSLKSLKFVDWELLSIG